MQEEPSFSLCKLADGEMKQSVRVNERGKSIMVVKREAKRREGKGRGQPSGRMR